MESAWCPSLFNSLSIKLQVSKEPSQNVLAAINFTTYSKLSPFHFRLELTYPLTKTSRLAVILSVATILGNHYKEYLQVKRIEKEHKIFPCNRTNRDMKSVKFAFMIERNNNEKIISLSKITQLITQLFSPEEWESKFQKAVHSMLPKTTCCELPSYIEHDSKHLIAIFDIMEQIFLSNPGRGLRFHYWNK